MEIFDEINNIKHCYLAQLGETGDNALRMVLEEAHADGPIIERTLSGRNNPLKVRAIETTSGCARFNIYFGNYIAYAVRDESYAQNAEEDVFEGRVAMVYSRSQFLDFVAKGTFATSDYPGPFVHYGFSTLNHFVDVVACAAPEIDRTLVDEVSETPRHANWAVVPNQAPE